MTILALVYFFIKLLLKFTLLTYKFIKGRLLQIALAKIFARLVAYAVFQKQYIIKLLFNNLQLNVPERVGLDKSYKFRYENKV